MLGQHGIKEGFFPPTNGNPDNRLEIVEGVKGVRWEREGGREWRHIRLTGSL